MKSILLFLFSIFFLFSKSIAQTNKSTQSILNGPQKIVIDTKHNKLLISNFNTGDLVQIDSLGNETLFVQGADFVDGIEIVGDTVFGVGSNRKIRAYHLGTRKLVVDITIPGSPTDYLSSITSDSCGHILISCPRLNEIYRMRIKDLTWWVFAKENGLNKPNGILLEREKNRIVVIDDSPDSKIHAVSLSDSSVITLKATSFDRPDGIVRDKHGNYYIGGFYLPGIYKTTPGFSDEFEFFFEGDNIVYPTYNATDNSLLVTHYMTNTWNRVPVKN